jgi:hypothetical protein
LTIVRRQWNDQAVKFLIFFLFLIPAKAAEPSMNGYTLKQFGNFAKNWHLVTVRYRKDTSEMRFTYANDLAWKALQERRTDYPDGAVFAKIGAMTQPDPGFTSSKVPSGARRIQFMVRDHQKHKDTDDWGYALFDGEGNLYPGDQKTVSQACMACHRLVPERGQIFSQIMFLEKDAPIGSSPLRFADVNVKKLPAALRAEIPLSVKKARELSGPLKEKSFFGTLDEIQPFLAEEAAKSGLPAVLISGKDFSAVLPQLTKCENVNEKSFLGLHTLPQSKQLFKNSFCQKAGN